MAKKKKKGWDHFVLKELRRDDMLIAQITIDKEGQIWFYNARVRGTTRWWPIPSVEFGMKLLSVLG